MDQKTKDKLLSGRLFLTYICGIVFAYAAYAKLLSGEAVSAIIVSVFTSYFSRHDRSNESNSLDKIVGPKVSP